MFNYILKRLLLLPLTLFCIILVNFVIINMAPGEPTSFTEVSAGGMASRQENRSMAFSSDERYLQFREFYGLTLPILFNCWPFLTRPQIENELWQLIHRKSSLESKEELSAKNYDALRIQLGDQSRFIMPKLLSIIEDQQISLETRQLATHFFIRGGSRQGYLGSHLNQEEKAWNLKIEKDTLLLSTLNWEVSAPQKGIQDKISQLRDWYIANKTFYHFDPTRTEKVELFLFETRFNKYMSRVLRLDFGTMRNDSSKEVIQEVAKRFKYSLTLALLPMLLTFIICQLFGVIMAFYQHRWPDYTLNLGFLILYAIPIFVMAPFLIEKVALHHNFPFTDIPIPIGGFTSPDRIYDNETTYQRLFDIAQHIFLPLIAVIYGSLAVESRLSRTAILEVVRKDYIRTAWAKGVGPAALIFKHVGRNAAITIVTSIAGSLGVILGGSLIVEILFDINGFGKFFYDAVINRDYNVIMFSSLAGSFLTLLGYLVADLAYMWLDPRITLD